jgi:hypothetical protein
MLKMQDDPDEFLKTKVEKSSRNIDPDGCLKTNDLDEIHGKADILLKGKLIISQAGARVWNQPSVFERSEV